jgi:predicted  nucleic acid-binding Zn-ribbon protein
MATKKKTAEVDYSMQEKIVALYELQKIDSQIDEINKVKGELPLEVQDLEDTVEGLNTRLENINREVDELASLTKQRQREIEEANMLIARYKEQQTNVRNNREYDSLEKEVEYQLLEIMHAEKRLKEYAGANKVKKVSLESAQNELTERLADLEVKRQELDSIESETADDVKSLNAKRVVAQSKIDERLLSAYDRIRSKVRNGLAVVTVKRDACSGCFNRIPPQRQADIRLGKKLIVCEYCGRILVPGDEI